MKSKQYQCPKCNTPIEIYVDFEEDIEFGLCISLEIYCPKCNDRRIQGWDDANEVIITLLNKIGT